MSRVAGKTGEFHPARIDSWYLIEWPCYDTIDTRTRKWHPTIRTWSTLHGFYSLPMFQSHEDSRELV